MSRRRRRAQKPQERRITAPVARVPQPGQQPSVPTYAHRRPGTPSLLTRENQDRFITLLRAGNNRRVAAQVAGLSYRTVVEWIKRGRGQTIRVPRPEYVQFARLVEEAEAQAEALVTGNLVQRSRVDTYAAVVWLRSRHPEDWPRSPGGEPDDRNFPPPAQPVERVTERNVVFLPLDAFEGVTRKLLEDKRSQRRANPETIIQEQPEAPIELNRDSRTRRTGLRVEATD